MLINNFASILTFVSTFGLALFVYLNNRHNSANISFSIFSLGVSIWVLTNLMADIAGNNTSLLFWTKAAIVGPAILPIALLYFSRVFPIPLRKWPPYLWLVLSLPSLIIWSLTPTSLNVKSAVLKSGNWVIEYGDLYTFLFIYFLVYLGLALFFLFKSFLHSKGLAKQQLRYLFWSLLIGIVFGIVTNLLLPLLGNSNLVSLGSLGALVLVSGTTYAIVKHRLLDIRLVVARTVSYSILVLIVAIFYISSTLLLTNFFFKTTTSTGQLVIYSILTLIVAFTFQPLRRFLEITTDKIFFKGDYDSNALLSSLTKIMAETILIDDIAYKLLKTLIAEMRITRGAFVLTDAGKIFVTETQGYREEPKFSEKDIFSLQAIDKMLVFEDLEESPAKELMRKLDVTVVVPLRTQVDHVGLLFLGEKASGEIYSDKDLKVLEIFAPEAAISFENAKSVEKIRRFNITLKEQVERATHELRDANEQLKDLDKLKDEFLSIASHDLRTPMTAIKGYLWMALNGRAGKIDNPDLKRYLDISYASSERMISLINDLLNVSRIKAGRMQMVFEEVDFKKVAEQVFAELASKATEKSITLKYNQDPKTPHVIADKQKMAEVLQNLIGNALKFTPEKGRITVTTKPSKEAGFVEIAVSDTGVGLSKEDSAKLFEKFSRVEQSYKAAKTTGGSGLGLYITKNYTEMHGGKIWVTSELGKGTTFTFTLKVYDKATTDKMNQENQKNQGSPSVPATNNNLSHPAVVSTIK